MKVLWTEQSQPTLENFSKTELPTENVAKQQPEEIQTESGRFLDVRSGDVVEEKPWEITGEKTGDCAFSPETCC